MFFFVIIQTVDPSLGKVDKDSLSQQTLMELLIQDIENKAEICYTENADGISQWEGVEVNEHGEFTDIDWYNKNLEGSLHVEWLPPTIKKANFNSNPLKGEIDTSKLPVSLLLLDFSNCQISGIFDLRELPPAMERIYVPTNNLTGSLHLENLPETLTDFCLYSNEFLGTVTLTHLPLAMKCLNVSKNNLTGAIDVTNLPARLRSLYLSQNEFSGLTDFSNLPDSLKFFYVNNTHLKGDLHCVAGKFYVTDDSKVNLIEEMWHRNNMHIHRTKTFIKLMIYSIDEGRYYHSIEKKRFSLSYISIDSHALPDTQRGPLVHLQQS